MTGQGCGEGANVPWDELARSGATLVVLMGLANLPTICQKLRATGLPPATPVAAIENGSRPDQRTIVGTLKDIAELVQAAGLRSPATIVVGHVVGLREQLGWFDREPTAASPSPANTTPMEVALT